MKLVIAQANLTLRGGAERVVLKIAEHYKASIITAEYEEENTFEGFKKLDIQAISGRSSIIPYGRVFQGLKYGMGFYNYKIDSDYDVINAHISPSHWIRNKNPKVLWYCHTPLRDVYDLYRFRMSKKKFYQKPVHIIGIKAVRTIDRRMVAKIEGIIANSNNTNSRIIKYLGRTDADVLGGGIDYENYRNRGDEHYFIYPSRISPNKRQDFAIRAFDIFRKRKKGYSLLIVGAVSKDKFYYDYYIGIKSLAEGVDGVKILDDVDDKELAKLYSKATAVLYPPMNEDYGLVPLEAMASSKPVIAVDEGGPKETIIEGKTGYLVKNEREMAEQMIRISEDAELAERMGINGRAHVIKDYSWEHFFSVFDAKLKKIAEQ